MHRQSRKPRGGPPRPACPSAPTPQGLFELRLRPSGRWGVFHDGAYVGSTGTSDHRLARIRLRMHERGLH